MKERKETFTKVNDALSEWVTSALLANHIINGKILQIKALEFAQRFPEENNFKASDEWLEGFKKRNSLCQVRLQGEANSAPLSILPEERDRLREIIGNPADIQSFAEDEVMDRIKEHLWIRHSFNQATGPRSFDAGSFR
ncbi:10814_t:CDS:2 [Paraglomus occultum]|uniref:10814_t:CDS:1 n=1 Tax=Paraglomus occultum TaxID=144539 RepID=A0A9N9BXD4_9GLOM|nr:10814_t:CDS:2 [Paraglomus occultum]